LARSDIPRDRPRSRKVRTAFTEKVFRALDSAPLRKALQAIKSQRKRPTR